MRLSANTRWLILRLTDTDVAHFLHRDRSLLDLILAARDGHVYVLDARGSSAHRVAFLPVSDIPPQHLPTQDSFYDETLTPECQASTLPPEQLVLLDGDWNAEELAQFERRYTQVYAFNSLFASGNEKDISGLKNRFQTHVFAGSGWTHVSALDQIVAAVPRSDKPRFKSIQLSSPGVVRYGVDGIPAARVREMLGVLRTAARELEHQYERLHRLLVDINKEARDLQSHGHPDQMLSLLAQPNPSLRQLGHALAERMGLDQTRIWSVAGTDVNSAELIANYYRRALELYENEVDGLAVIV